MTERWKVTMNRSVHDQRLGMKRWTSKTGSWIEERQWGRMCLFSKKNVAPALMGTGSVEGTPYGRYSLKKPDAGKTG